MKVTIIPSDRAVYIDSEAVFIPADDFPGTDPNWHAVQVSGGVAIIERKQGEPLRVDDEDVDSLIAPYLAAREAVLNPPETEPTPADVDAERNRRIDGGFEFAGVRYQTRPGDRENIAGASIAALGAIGAGAQPGDYRWHGGSSDFVWIAEDNSTHPMDAQTVFAFGQAAMQHKQGLIFAARALKDMDPIPADYADDQYWDQALTA